MFVMVAASVAIFLVLPAAADPLGPLEQPPDEFTGAQYIDTAGCVYLRQGKVWAPRLDRDGTVICGYPPSLPGLAIKQAEAPDTAALRLAVSLAEGLQDGDVPAGRVDLLKRAPADVPRPKSGPLAQLDLALRNVSEMRAASAQQQGGAKPLCDLLGYDAAGTGAGGEWALGFCGGGTVLQPKPTVPGSSGGGLTGAVGAAGKADPAAHRQGASPATAPDQTGTVRRAPTLAATRPVPTTATVTGKGAKGSTDLVPAAARYVQIGRYPVPAEAEAVILKVVRFGYPVVRGHKLETESGGRLVMAGPFADRQALIAALNHLRQTGYPRAVAR